MRIVNVVAAIIVEDGKVFATQRGYGHYKDWWEFPGGKIEAGETPEEALKREIREELNSDISVDEYLCDIEYDYPEFHLSMKCFLCSVVRGKLELLEHEAARWLTLNNIESVDWLPADIEVVNRLREIMRG